MLDFNKIFGVGISRTGTTSLTAALRMLGIPTVHWPLKMEDFCANRGAVDVTVSCRFQELDQIFPGSLFIYTERPRTTWLPSVMRHYHRVQETLRLRPGLKEFSDEADVRIYGSLRPTADDFLAAYQRHHRLVLRYFRGQEHRLLRLRIIQGEGWNRLCPFLGLPPLGIPFPRVNPAKGELPLDDASAEASPESDN